MKCTPPLCSLAAIILLFLTVKLYAQTPFITTWRTTEPNESIEIPTKVDSNYVYDYVVDWGDGTISKGLSGNATHIYEIPGFYQVSISGCFPAISFGDSDDLNSAKLFNINQWGSQQWQTMERAFCGCKTISKFAWPADAPDLSSVKNMSGMFANCTRFNQDIGSWDVSSVKDMSYMFAGARSFNKYIGDWDVSNVTNMSHMFYCCASFNQQIGSWDVTNVKDLSYMFAGILDIDKEIYIENSFNQDIGSWDVSNVTDMSHMFSLNGSFNQDIGKWDVSSVNDMSFMFGGSLQSIFWWSYFNQDIGSWDVSHVTNMRNMFCMAEFFNQDIGDWDVSSVTDMSYMFSRAGVFNQDIGNWDVSAVCDMSHMFYLNRSFNQDIGNWTVSNVTDMSFMFGGFKYDLFWGSPFNHDISNWDVSNVTSMNNMFSVSKNFNCNIGDWDISSVTDMSCMFYDAEVSTIIYDALLMGWSKQDLQPCVKFCGGRSTYCNGDSSRNYIMNNFGWEIYDGGKDADCSVFKSPMVYPNPSSGNFSIPLNFPVEQIGKITCCDALGHPHTLTRLSAFNFQITGKDGTYYLIIEMQEGEKHIEKLVLIN